MTAVSITGPGDGEHFQDAARDLAPGTKVRILATGQVLEV
jgi:hypothetical protein